MPHPASQWPSLLDLAERERTKKKPEMHRNQTDTSRQKTMTGQNASGENGAPFLQESGPRSQMGSLSFLQKASFLQENGESSKMLRARVWPVDSENEAIFEQKRQKCPEKWRAPKIDYTYIYIYAGELLVCPPFGLQRVISLATLRVISLSTFLGAIFAL